MNFFKQKWVMIVAFVLIIIGVVALMLSGMSVADIGKIPTLVGAILTAIGILITFIRDHILSKYVAIAEEYISLDKGKVTVKNTVDTEEDRKRLNPKS